MLTITFKAGPLTISFSSGSTPIVIPLTTITGSFDLLMTCEPDSLKFSVNGQAIASIVAYHSTRVNGNIVQPVITSMQYSAYYVIGIGKISWTYGESK
jgi:hypothetical protein